MRYHQLKQRHSLLYAILQDLLHRLRNHDILERAYGVAFNFTLAIFPAIIFSFTLIPYIPIAGLEVKIVTFLQDVIPDSAYEALIPTIQDTVRNQRTGLLSFGFISTLYLATNGIMFLMKSFYLFNQDLSYTQRSYVKQRAIATVLTLVFVCALFTTILLLVFARQALDYMFFHEIIASQAWVNLMLGLRWIIVFLMFFATITAIYYWAPVTKQRVYFVAMGALVATVLSIMASIAFSYYANNFAYYNRLYGSLGMMIALMIWLFLISVTFLVGFEVSISITKILQKPLVENEKTNT